MTELTRELPLAILELERGLAHVQLAEDNMAALTAFAQEIEAELPEIKASVANKEPGANSRLIVRQAELEGVPEEMQALKVARQAELENLWHQCRAAMPAVVKVGSEFAGSIPAAEKLWTEVSEIAAAHPAAKVAVYIGLRGQPPASIQRLIVSEAAQLLTALRSFYEEHQGYVPTPR